MKTDTRLEDHLYSEDAGENEVESVEDFVAIRTLVDGVLGGERDATGTDDDHDKQIEVTQIDDEVTETTQPARTRTSTRS